MSTNIFEDLYNLVFGKVQEIPKIEIWNDMYKLWGFFALYFCGAVMVAPKVFQYRRIRNTLIVLLHVCVASAGLYYCKVNG